MVAKCFKLKIFSFECLVNKFCKKFIIILFLKVNMLIWVMSNKIIKIKFNEIYHRKFKVFYIKLKSIV
jgi:hypothetical protein